MALDRRSVIGTTPAILVGQQRKGQTFLVHELVVADHRIGRDAEDLGTGLADLRAGLETSDQGADQGDCRGAVSVFLLGNALGGLLGSDVGCQRRALRGLGGEDQVDTAPHHTAHAVP